MAKLVKQSHGGAINRFEKGESGNPRGRAKKFANILKPYGYTRDEIMATLQNMQGMTLDRLKEIHEHKQATILERTIAHVLYKGLLKGDLSIYEQIWDRVIGRPKNTVETENKTQVVMAAIAPIETTDPQEAMRAYQKIMME